MNEKRFKMWSPELDLDLTDKIENQYQLEEDIEEEEIIKSYPEGNVYITKENNMKKLNPKVIWIVVLAILFVWFLFTIDTNTEKEISIDTNTEKEIEAIRQKAVERKNQKDIRDKKRELNREELLSIEKVKKLDKQIEQYRQSSLNLIK